MNSANILVIEDNEDLSFTLSKVLHKEGFKTFTAKSGEDGLLLFRKEIVDLLLLDLKLPKMNGLEVLSRVKEMDPDLAVIMMTASTDVKPAIEAMKRGAVDYLMKPFELDELKLVVKKALEMHQLKIEVARLRRDHSKTNPHDTLYGESPRIKEIRRLIQIVSETPRTSVLIQGESGTGKELVSNAVHVASSRAGKPYIKINCSAIPDNLLESELFGHEKGAFTDAKMMKKGLFEMANGGTIFLDEISSMKLSLQPKILRVLETQTFRRIGGIADIKIDIRVIAASNTDLAEQVKLKEFRDDLYYRLKVMEIDLPPLRDRQEDIMLLAKLFLQEFNKEFNKHVQKFHPKTEELLLAYPWPGNVRELKNVIERAVILTPDDTLHPDHLPIELKEGGRSPVPERGSMGKMSLEEMEKMHIDQVLQSVKGNKSQAAKILNISRSTLREKLKAYHITE
jgi:two-component system, NtrC family, response regulator AtoC